ncbi:MAG: M2 family metallopeptidase, partial [Brevundimonas sp.]
MKRLLMAATAACALAAGGLAVQAQTAATDRFPATPEGARAFVMDAEARLTDVAEYAARVAWVRNTYIIHDTMWLEARANTEYTELGVELANAAAHFNTVDADPETRRKLDILRQGLTMPAPNRPGAAAELAEIATRLDSTYATGRFE